MNLAFWTRGGGSLRKRGNCPLVDLAGKVRFAIIMLI